MTEQLSGDYVPPDGGRVALKFKDKPAKLNFRFVYYHPPAGNSVRIDFLNPYTPPEGNRVRINFTNDPDEDSPREDQYLFPVGFDSADIGGAALRKSREYLRPAPIDPDAVPSPRVWLYQQRITVAGWSALAWGTASVQNKDRTVAPPGILAGVGGSNHQIINRNRYVFAGNIAPPSMAAPSVWLWQRYVKPTGLQAAQFGTQRLSHEVQHAQNAGAGNWLRWGTAWVSLGLRAIAPPSIARDDVGFPTVGGTRYLEPQGWDSQAFGTRIIPEVQAVYPQGFAEQWGQATVFNYRQYVAPQGFHTTVQEQLRWGWAHAWNLRQIIRVEHDPTDGMNPPEWPLWTKIENRNRTVGALGFVATGTGRPMVLNNARVLAPLGWDAQGLTKGVELVAYRVRVLRLEGMEPPYISAWHRTFNAAAVLAPAGWDAAGFGRAALVNTRRVFDRIGAMDAAVLGVPMVADRVRTVSIEKRYTIEPPAIPLPDVQNLTNYVEPLGWDSARIGLSSWSIHWRIITPRWTHRDYFGEPQVKNKTPNLYARGIPHDEWGDAFVRLQWRQAQVQGYVATLFGNATIADKTRTVRVSGLQSMTVSTLAKVTKTGAPPYALQTITLAKFDRDGLTPLKYGDGIEPPFNQVPAPRINQNVLKPNGFDALRFGSAMAENMGIRVEPGFRSDVHGTPEVSLKIRAVVLAEQEDSLSMGKPSLSPHTIYAVMDAPPQAKYNHVHPATLHYVNSDGGYRAPGEVFGLASVSNRHRVIRMSGGMPSLAFGTARVANWLHYIKPSGIGVRPFGIVSVDDGRPKTLKQIDSASFMEFGKPTVRFPQVVGPVQARGFQAFAAGAPRVEHFHRTVRAQGFSAMAMGTRRPGDTPYMWQGLRVGPFVPMVLRGPDTSSFGTPFVAPRVRELLAGGIDGLSIGYTFYQFPLRMRVTRAQEDTGGMPAQALMPAGWASSSTGTADVRNRVHYIRPDGNAEQYRKGVHL